MLFFLSSHLKNLKYWSRLLRMGRWKRSHKIKKFKGALLRKIRRRIQGFLRTRLIFENWQIKRTEMIKKSKKMTRVILFLHKKQTTSNKPTLIFRPKKHFLTDRLLNRTRLFRKPAKTHASLSAQLPHHAFWVLLSISFNNSIVHSTRFYLSGLWFKKGTL